MKMLWRDSRMRALAGGVRLPAAQFRAAPIGGTDNRFELWIYDYIDSWGDPWGISANDVTRALVMAGGADVVVHINSPGGEIFEGIAIHSALRNYAGGVEIQVDALAASAASVIAMAGRPLVMQPGSMLMIHDGWDVVAGTAAELTAAAVPLDKASQTMAELYAARAGGDPAVWREAMTAAPSNLGTWYTAAEAVEAGLADKVAASPSTSSGDDQVEGGPFDAVADLSMYNGVPVRMVAGKLVPDEGWDRRPAALVVQRDNPTPEPSTVDTPAGLSGNDLAALRAALKGMQVNP